MKNKLFFLLSIVAIGTLLSSCGPSTINVSSQPVVRTITVSGTGLVTLTPDIARVSIGVHSQDASATTAMNDNNEKTEAVIAAIREAGVAEQDIQTTNFSVYPQQQYDDRGTITGIIYMVDNTVYVTIRDLDKLGDMLDASVRAGANNISGISFDVADKSNALSEARQEAVAEARKQAEELTSASGVRLGEVQTISYYDSTPSPYYYETRALDMASSVPVQAGSMQITTTVTIVYIIE